jgi:hypothetical protein
VSNLGPLQTNGATEATLEDIWAKLSQLVINPDGSINVNAGTLSIAPVSALVVGGITSIPPNTLTTIATFTASAAINMSKVSVSGTDYAKFQLFKNTVLIDTKRSGPERSVEFNFNNPLKLIATDIIDIKVTHYVIGTMADFEATIYGG